MILVVWNKDDILCFNNFSLHPGKNWKDVPGFISNLRLRFDFIIWLPACNQIKYYYYYYYKSGIFLYTYKYFIKTFRWRYFLLSMLARLIEWWNNCIPISTVTTSSGWEISGRSWRLTCSLCSTWRIQLAFKSCRAAFFEFI